MRFHQTREPACFPSAEELRMVRAIALIALIEAACRGEYRASFHGFRVQAVRQCVVLDADAVVDVYLCVRLGNRLVEHSLLAIDIPQSPRMAVSARPEAVTTDTGVLELTP